MPIVYVKNCTQYPVRLCIGNEYPNSIASCPGQVIEFPLNTISHIAASTYGKFSHYFVGYHGNCDFTKWLNDHPECKSHDSIINITYGQNTSNGGLWQKTKNLLTQGQWEIIPEKLDAEKDCSDYPKEVTDSSPLYAMISKTSKNMPKTMVLYAALVWSLFPRARKKIEAQKPVYPFHILGLDLGGLNASPDQLSNWSKLLSKSLRKKVYKLNKPALDKAVQFTIANAINALKKYQYYLQLSPDDIAPLLDDSTQDSREEAIVIMQKLKERIKEDPTAVSLVGQLEEICLNGSAVQQLQLPPTPPPPPNSPISTSYQEKAINTFLQDYEIKKAEEQSFCDKVTINLFEKIDKLDIDKTIAIHLKWATLSKLAEINQDKNPIKQLTKIMKYLTSDMLQTSCMSHNPSQTLQNWISLLVRVEQERASAYALMGPDLLQKALADETAMQNYQALLFSQLRKQIKRFGQPGSELSD